MTIMQDLDDHSVTAEVLARLSGTPDPRLRLVLSALVQHLHDFARETELTEAEWMYGIDFLTRTGQLCSPVRQEFILLSDTLGLSQLVVSQNHGRSQGATEQTVFGPFYVPGGPVRPSGYDISKGADGQALYAQASVHTQDGAPVPGALIEFWHADPQGGYDTESEGWSLDEARFRGNLVADHAGQVHFWTTKPSSYPIPMDGPVGESMRATQRSPMRPAHLHARIAHPGFETLVTHVFDEADPYLNSDAVFGVISSCVAHFQEHEAGAFEGKILQQPFSTVQCEFVLERLEP
jgi:hydroxyquinol 1,2-dioxygenase